MKRKEKQDTPTSLESSPLGGLAFFRSVEPGPLARLEEETVLRECRRGQVLFYKGEVPGHLVCILEGHLKLLKVDGQGREIVIRFLGPGDVTGFRPMLAGEVSAAVAECVSPARLAMVPRAAFLRLVEECPAFSRSLLALLARELKESEERWLERSSDSAEERVRRFLIQLGRFQGEGAQADGVRVTVPKQEIALAADVTPFTLSRILGRLAALGVVKVEPRALVIFMPQMLMPETCP